MGTTAVSRQLRTMMLILGAGGVNRWSPLRETPESAKIEARSRYDRFGDGPLALLMEPPPLLMGRLALLEFFVFGISVAQRDLVLAARIWW